MKLREALQKAVIPAKAGIQVFESRSKSTTFWIPAFAGMTPARLLQSILRFIARIPKCVGFAKISVNSRLIDFAF
jgi:hypothetical protein